MKLAYAIVGNAGNYVVIYDEMNAVAQPSQFDAKAIGIVSQPEWHPMFKAIVQNDALFTLPNSDGFSPAKFRQALGNVECAVRAKFTVPYKTRADATGSLRTWSNLLAIKVNFQLTQDGEIQYYPNASLDAYDGDLQGTTVVHQFSFISDAVTNVPPQ